MSKVALASPSKKVLSKAEVVPDPLNQEAKEDMVENPFSKGLKSLAESQLPAWAQEDSD